MRSVLGGCRFSLNSTSAVSRHRLEADSYKTHHFSLKCVSLTMSFQHPLSKTLILPTSVNTSCFRYFSTNLQLSRESQNSEASLSKTQVTSSVLDGEIIAMAMWSLGLGAVGAAIAGIILANTDYLLTKPAPAALEYLENVDLRSIDDDEKTLKAKSLWEKSGAVIMAVRRPG